ncbi:MAG: hypothetical protein KAH44_10430 [Oricola sp.]|nr:hypothetical protein [Oricola sp.]
MSLSTYYMRQASRKVAAQATRTMRLEETLALRAAPVALWLVLHALSQNSTSLMMRPGLRYALSRSREDVLKTGRLGAADVRARGDELFQKVMGPHAGRAVRAIENLAKVDARRARTILAISAIAAVSALGETKRELNLSAGQTVGVLLSEAAFMDNADPALLRKVRDWVFRPPWWSRLMSRAAMLLHRPAPSPSL